MYRWIVEADIYRLLKALRDNPTAAERETINQRLSIAETRLLNARVRREHRVKMRKSMRRFRSYQFGFATVMASLFGTIVHQVATGLRLL